MSVVRTPHNSTEYRPDIDGLRAVAVLGVLLCHYEFLCPGGFVGVDVFFVISGFLITKIIRKEILNDEFSFKLFFERRMRRIAPALLVMVFFCIFAGYLVLLPNDYILFARSLFGVASLASNIQFWCDTGYFDSSADEKVLLHTWSLSVEEQFYFVLPCLLVGLHFFSSSRGMKRLLLAMTLGSFLLSSYGALYRPSGTFYLLPTRAWELMVGSLISYCIAVPLPLLQKHRGFVATLASGLILVPYVAYTPQTPFPGLAAVPPVLGAVLLIITGSNEAGATTVVHQILQTRYLRSIGLISYSLYLWHWPILVFFKQRYFLPPTIGTRTLLFILSFLAAYCSWRFIETPFRKKYVLKTFCGLTTCVISAHLVLAVAGAIILAADGFPDRVQGAARSLLDTAAIGSDDYIVEMNVQDVENGLRRIGSNIVEPETIVWGDSHAMAVLKTIGEVFERAGQSVAVATHSGTPPVLGFERKSTFEFGLKENEVPFNDAVFRFIKEKNIKKVILIGFWRHYFDTPGFADAFAMTCAKLEELNIDVYFMMAVPDFDYDVPKAVLRSSLGQVKEYALSMEEEEYERKNSYRKFVLDRLQPHGLTILDPVPYLKSRSKSGMILPCDTDGIFYRDAHHLSNYGASVLIPMFETILKE